MGSQSDMTEQLSTQRDLRQEHDSNSPFLSTKEETLPGLRGALTCTETPFHSASSGGGGAAAPRREASPCRADGPASLSQLTTSPSSPRPLHPATAAPAAYSPPAIARNPSVGLRTRAQHIIPNHKALRSCISQFTAAGHVCLSVWL